MKKKGILFISLLFFSFPMIWAGGQADDQSGNDGDKDVISEGTGPSWTWDTSPHTITWFAAEDWYHKSWDVENNLWDKMVTEETGITVEMITGPVEKLNAMIAAGTLPDVITVSFNMPQRLLLEESDMLAPLDDLIAKYAPDYEIPESMKNWYRNEKTGEYYGYVNYFKSDDIVKADDYVPTHNTLYGRNDIMDQLGITREDFSTPDGMYKALKKVRDANLQYKGLDVVPFLSRNGVISFAEFFGAKGEDEKGQYLDIRRSSEILEALKFFNKLYREELLPGEQLVYDFNQIGEKVQNGSLFLLHGWPSMSWRIRELYNSDNDAMMVTVGPLKGESVEEIYLHPSDWAGWTSTMINVDAERKDRIIRFFEYLSQEEMQVASQVGVKGLAWNYGADGRIEKTEEFKNAEAAGTSDRYKGNMWMFDRWLPYQRIMPTSDNPQEKELDESYFAQWAKWDSKMIDDVSPLGGTEEAGISAKLRNYWSQQEASMIMAKSEEEVEKIFNETLAHMDVLGWEKWYEAVNANFQKNKRKMNVDFAHPANR